MSTVKPRKDSLVDFIERFSKEDKQINFFLNLKWPDGFSCDKCDCHDYYLVKRKNIKNGYLLICRKCGHQHSLLSHTIFQDSNLPLIKILIGLYVFFSSNNGVYGNQLANYMDVNVKTARKFIKKCQILMAENKQPTLLILSTSEDNEYPQYIKLHALPDYIESYLKEKCIFNDQQFLIAMVIELFSPGKINTVRKQCSRLYR